MTYRKQLTILVFAWTILGSGCATQPAHPLSAPAAARVPKVDRIALTAAPVVSKVAAATTGLSPLGLAARGANDEARALFPPEPEPLPVRPKPSKPRAGYYWQPDKAPRGPVKIVVSLADQKAYVYRSGVLIGKSRVSTGRKGFETPTGTFSILQKEKEHMSNLYEDGKMPYMQRLTWDGLALHGGRVPGYPASHGCVRLPHSFSKLVYGVTSNGAKVVITGDHEEVGTN